MIDDLRNLVSKLSADRYNDSDRINKLEKLAKSFEEKINKELKERNEEERKKTENIEQRVKYLETKVSSLATSQIDTNAINVVKKNLWSDIVAPKNAENVHSKKTEPEMAVITSVLSEQQEREKRSHSVIIFGLVEVSLPSSSNAAEGNKDVLKEKILMDQVSELFDKIGVGREKIEKIRRFREKNGIIAPVLVKLKDGTDRIKVVAAGKRIKEITGLDKTFINLDLTQTEREFDKKLRAERDRLNKEEEQKGRHFYFRIRNDQIIRTEYRERRNEPSTSGNTRHHRADN